MGAYANERASTLAIGRDKDPEILTPIVMDCRTCNSVASVWVAAIGAQHEEQLRTISFRQRIREIIISGPIN
ncbi:MAG: hypothetical protein JWR21_919 [Herminiimonas sp.]|nr:hypothetical protein [Herminiimonas sp.]